MLCRTLPASESDADPSWEASSTSTNARPETAGQGPATVFWNPTGLITDNVAADAARRRPDITIETVPGANHYTIVLVDRFAAQIAHHIEAADKQKSPMS